MERVFFWESEHDNPLTFPDTAHACFTRPSMGLCEVDGRRLDCSLIFFLVSWCIWVLTLRNLGRVVVDDSNFFFFFLMRFDV